MIFILHFDILYSICLLMTLCFENEFLKPLAKQANINLKLLMNWLKANKISLNTSKTELLLFRPIRNKIDYDFKIKINGHRLRPCKVLKYLGVYIDEHLNWKHHIDFVCTLKELIFAELIFAGTNFRDFGCLPRKLVPRHANFT